MNKFIAKSLYLSSAVLMALSLGVGASQINVSARAKKSQYIQVRPGYEVIGNHVHKMSKKERREEYKLDAPFRRAKVNVAIKDAKFGRHDRIPRKWFTSNDLKKLKANEKYYANYHHKEQRYYREGLRSKRPKHMNRSQSMRYDIKQLDSIFWQHVDVFDNQYNSLSPNANRSELAKAIRYNMFISSDQFHGDREDRYYGEYIPDGGLSINSNKDTMNYRRVTIQEYNDLRDLLTKSQRRQVTKCIRSAKGRVPKMKYGPFVKKLSNANRLLANDISKD